MRVILALILITFLTFSCDKNKVYENTTDFKNAFWLADSLKTFNFLIPDNNIGYTINLSVRNGIKYPHSNIYIQYQICDSLGGVLDEELRNFQLFNAKLGYPLGNGSGNIFEHQFGLLIDYKFPYTGPFIIKFRQYMRYDSLPQVYSVGVRIETPE